MIRYLAAVFVDTDVTVGDDETVIVVEVIHPSSDCSLLYLWFSPIKIMVKYF